jgi:1-acyl-sn-glycerol-3-phosphate acyltransferase
MEAEASRLLAFRPCQPLPPEAIMRGMSTPDPASARWEESAGAAASALPLRMTRALRLRRAGLCFAYFGVGIWFLGAVLPPLVALPARLRGLSPDALTRRTQRVVHHFFRSFLRCITDVTRIGHVETVGAEALTRGPVLVVANHPSLIDTPLLGAIMPQADFIVGPEWLRNGWMRRAIEGAGYLRAEDGAEVVRVAAERLRAGRSVVVYPEGSRTPPEGLRRFQRGAAHIALEAGCDILPVTLSVSPRVLMQGERWTDYPSGNPVWRVEVGEPIRTPVSAGSEGRALAARRLTGVLEEHFEERWERGRT